MADLEAKLKETKDARFRIIATDGVFSMDGYIANLKGICELADQYQALVMVDDSHAVGFIGDNGRGTPEYCDVMGRVDIITGTLGKALGGASGGYTASRQPIVDILRQRSRPYLFSNSLAPVIASYIAGGARPARGRRAAREAARQRRSFPRGHAGAGIRPAARRPPHHPDHDRRRSKGL